MIILDPQGMPINLGQTPREDSPEAAFPVLAYDGKNILPTALGYKSFFGNSNKFYFQDQDTLRELLVQKLIMYQTANYTTIFIALCEDGVYVNTITEASGGSNTWQRVINSPATPGVRRQWSCCVIKNFLYIYQQGMGYFYGFVDSASYQETTIPEVIKDAEINQHWEQPAWLVGILQYKPNFINITAQIGIFKAGNRLGFWDSEGAVAWSSATQVYDFKPSTTSFAGITTFTDVIGTISSIHQHGSGFIIYATKSIVLCQTLNGSPEKWAGRAIFNEVGVLFDIQVAVGQPDTTHYAITSGGLCVINSGTPEFVETEVMDYVKKNNKVYGLTFVDSRYLFIHCTNDPNISLPTVTVQVPDAEGHYYHFPKPDPVPQEEFIDYLSGFLGSTIPGVLEEFESHEPVEGIIPPTEEALLPCWSGQKFNTNFTPEVLEYREVRDGYNIRIPSIGSSGVYQPVMDIRKPKYESYYYEVDQNFYDKAGQDYTEIMLDSFTKVMDTSQIVTAGMQTFVEGAKLIDPNTPAFTSLGGEPGIYSGTVKVQGLDWTWHNVPDLTTVFEFEVSDCDHRVLANLARVEFSYEANIVEEISMGYDFEMHVAITRMGEQTNYHPIWRCRNRWIGGGWLYLPATPKLMSAFQTMTGRSGPTFPSNTWDVQTVPGLAYGLTVYGIGIPGTPTYFNRHPHRTPSRVLNALMEGGVETIPGSAQPSGGDEGCPIKGPADPTSNWDLTYGIDPSYGIFCGNPIGYGSGRIKLQTQVREVKDSEDVCQSNTGELYSSEWIDVPFESSSGIVPGTHLIDGEPAINKLSSAQIAAAEGYKDLLQNLQLDLLSLELICTATLYPNEPTDTKPLIFEAEVSGFGYFPKGGFSFRRTHSRSIFKPCDPASRGSSTLLPEDVDKIGGIVVNPNLPTPGEVPLNPPYEWDYPEKIPLPPNYILLQKGTASPYYVTYESALVLDTQLSKWGIYSDPHKLVYSLYPINRTDQTISPLTNDGMLAGSFLVDGSCTVFSSDNPTSAITYGKIGDYRLGMSTYTKITAQFLGVPTCDLIGEVSLTGNAKDPALSQAIDVSDTSFVTMPFTLTGKWLNIRLEGTFDLVQLTFESSATSRR